MCDKFSFLNFRMITKKMTLFLVQVKDVEFKTKQETSQFLCYYYSKWKKVSELSGHLQDSVQHNFRHPFLLDC